MKPSYAASTLLSLTIAVWLAGCSHQTSTAGAPDQWIRAKHLSARISFSGNEIRVRNDATTEVSILPVTVRAWYEIAGAKEITLSSGGITALKRGEQFAFSIPPFLAMEPSSGGAEEEPFKLQIELGPRTAKEAFTVQR